MKKVLILTDGKAGHENQSRALARHLGYACDVAGVSFPSRLAKALSYPLDRLGILSASLFRVADIPARPSAYAAVLGTGSGTFYPVKVLAHRWGVPCGVVLYPRGYRLSTFDAILAPAFDRPKKAAHVIEIPANLVSGDAAFYAEGTAAFRARHPKGAVPERVVAVIVGGPNAHASMTPDWMRATLDGIFSRHRAEAGKGRVAFWVTTSRRTPPEVEKVVASYPWDYRLLYSQDHFNPIPAFVSCADRLYVTAESTGMLSEACTFGTARVEALDDLRPGKSKFRRFVEDLSRAGYLGGRRKIDLTEEIARARKILFRTAEA